MATRSVVLIVRSVEILEVPLRTFTLVFVFASALYAGPSQAARLRNRSRSSTTALPRTLIHLHEIFSAGRKLDRIVHPRCARAAGIARHGAGQALRGGSEGA